MYGMYYPFRSPWKKLFMHAAFKSHSNIILQMVTWSELSSAINANIERKKTVLPLTANTQGPVDQFPYDTVVPTLTSEPVASVPVANEPPAPTVHVDEPVLMVNPTPVVSVLQPIRIEIAEQHTNADEPKAPKATREPVSLKHEVDPIAIGIELSDVLYTGSSAQTKHTMECEEAQRIEGLLSELYKSQGGRSRGWTKAGLEEWIKPRCASGGNIRELDRAKVAFTWQLVCDDKAMSAFLDFLCVAKKIRVAIWFSEEKRVVVYPAADYVGAEPIQSYPLFHVDCKGHLRKGMKSSSDLVQFCEDNHYTMLPATTVMSSLSKLTLDELESVAQKLGMVECGGKKNERVAKIASYKLRQRLGLTH
jgi:hypothetical protein